MTSNPICEVISFDGQAGPKVSDFFEEILDFRGSIPNGGIIYLRTTILKFYSTINLPRMTDETDEMSFHPGILDFHLEVRVSLGPGPVAFHVVRALRLISIE